MSSKSGSSFSDFAWDMIDCERWEEDADDVTVCDVTDEGVTGAGVRDCATTTGGEANKTLRIDCHKQNKTKTYKQNTKWKTLKLCSFLGSIFIYISL